MKKWKYLFLMSIICLSISSCSSTPEELGRKDAQAFTRAVERQSDRAYDRAERRRIRHEKKFLNNRWNPEAYVRYVEAYGQAL